MRMVTVLRHAASAIALGGLALVAAPLMTPPAQSQANFVQNGEAGFVVSFIEYGLSEDAAQTGACPNGMTLGGNRLREAIAAGEAPTPAEGTGEAFILRMANMFDGAGAQGGQGQAAQAAPPRPQPQNQQAALEGFRRLLSGPNPCSRPEDYQPDPNFRTVQVNNVPAYGIDLDGQNATASGRAAPNTCAHNDFRGFHGERGIDNQFFRTVGCSPSFQPGNMSTTWNIEMLTGAWGIVFRLRGVDDIRNDSNVTVEIAANADPIQLSPNREPLPAATYAMWQDPRFRAATHGRIRNGVLTTDPVDMRFWKITAGFWTERPLLDGRLQVTISPEGAIEGYLAGYTPVDDMFNLQYSYRRATTGPNGEAAPLAVGNGLGDNVTVGHTCNGAYYALLANADGHPDANGRCTSISTQYHIRAIPAFVVDAATSSANADLGPPAAQYGN